MSPRRQVLYVGLAMAGHRLRYRALMDASEPLIDLDRFCTTAGRAVGLDYRRLVRSTRDAVEEGVGERECVCAALEYVIDDLERLMVLARQG